MRTCYTPRRLFAALRGSSPPPPRLVSLCLFVLPARTTLTLRTPAHGIPESRTAEPGSSVVLLSRTVNAGEPRPLSATAGGEKRANENAPPHPEGSASAWTRYSCTPVGGCVCVCGGGGGAVYTFVIVCTLGTPLRQGLFYRDADGGPATMVYSPPTQPVGAFGLSQFRIFLSPRIFLSIYPYRPMHVRAGSGCVSRQTHRNNRAFVDTSIGHFGLEARQGTLHFLHTSDVGMPTITVRVCYIFTSVCARWRLCQWSGEWKYARVFFHLHVSTCSCARGFVA